MSSMKPRSEPAPLADSQPPARASATDLPGEGFAGDGPRPLASRLLDGHGTGECIAQACRAWREDDQMRRAWHEYHLIGDVLRSQDLCSTPARDTRFLERLRERLADEPPLLVPAQPEPTTRHARAPRWMVPAAVAAGFVAVAGVLVVMRGTLSEPAGQVLAGNGAAPQAVPATTLAGQGVLGPAEATMIRDARVEEYLQAHRQMRVTPAAAMPGGGVRNVDLIVGPVR